MATQLKHKSLTKTHHLGRALAAWRKVGTAFATAHRQRRQRVFESLLEGEELQNTQVYARMETNAALVWADGIVVLDTIAHIRPNLPIVVHPRNPKLIDSVGNTEAFNQIFFFKLGMLVVLLFNRTKHLLYCLMILRFVGKASFQLRQYFFCVHSNPNFKVKKS